MYGYVIMSNHLHMVVQSGNGELSDLLRDFKKFTAAKIIEKIKSNQVDWWGIFYLASFIGSLQFVLEHDQ